MRSPHKHWSLLVKDKLVDEIVLQPGSFISSAELTKRKNTYPDDLNVTTTITRDTLFWYPPGIYSLEKQVAGLYLQGKISEVARHEALEGFREMKWTPPKSRKETATAIKRQEGNVAPGEILIGYMDRGTIEQTLATKENEKELKSLARIFKEMNDVFSRTLPQHFGLQNRPLPEEVRREETKKKGSKPGPEYGGIPSDIRQLLTAFSTITLLKSCPASIHKDAGNARGDQTSFTVLTTVREDDGGGGGEFCFIEYGLRVPVKPGDILIGQTTREWHCNLTPVRGTKYSMVAYYRRNVANPLMQDATRRRRKQR